MGVDTGERFSSLMVQLLHVPTLRRLANARRHLWERDGMEAWGICDNSSLPRSINRCVHLQTHMTRGTCLATAVHVIYSCPPRHVVPLRSPHQFVHETNTSVDLPNT